MPGAIQKLNNDLHYCWLFCKYKSTVDYTEAATGGVI